MKKIKKGLRIFNIIIFVIFILFTFASMFAGAGYLFNLIFGVPFSLGIIIWILAEFFTVSLLFVLDDDYTNDKDW